MKKVYASPDVGVLYFEEKDLITESPSAFDGTGYIPETWWNA